MNTAEQIILVVLAAVLALFLLLAIILVVQIMRLVKTINRVTEQAENLIENAATATEVFKHAAGPVNVLRVVNNIVKTINKMKRGK